MIFQAIIDNNRPPACSWHLDGDGKQEYYYYWPYLEIIALCTRSLTLSLSLPFSLSLSLSLTHTQGRRVSEIRSGYLSSLHTFTLINILSTASFDQVDKVGKGR